MSTLPKTNREINPMRDYQQTTPATLMQVYDVLSDMKYPIGTINRILVYISINGTTECCTKFRNETERRLVEDLIPNAPYDDWVNHEPYRYACTDGE